MKINGKMKIYISMDGVGQDVEVDDLVEYIKNELKKGQKKESTK